MVEHGGHAPPEMGQTTQHGRRVDALFVVCLVQSPPQVLQDAAEVAGVEAAQGHTAGQCGIKMTVCVDQPWGDQPTLCIQDPCLRNLRSGAACH